MTSTRKTSEWRGPVWRWPWPTCTNRRDTMKTMLMARLRHLLLGPGRHRRMKHPEPARISPIELMLMFSGQGADTKYYPEKNGCRQEYIVR